MFAGKKAEAAHVPLVHSALDAQSTSPAHAAGALQLEVDRFSLPQQT